MKISDLIFSTFTNGTERLDFTNVDIDIRGRLGRLLDGDKFVDESVVEDMCNVLHAQWLDIRSPKRELEHQVGQESGDKLIVKKLDPRFALPPTCILLMETGLSGVVAGAQVPIYLRMKVQAKQTNRMGSFRQQQRAGMKKEVTQFCISDAEGEPLSGFYDLPFDFRNLSEFTEAIRKCAGGYIDGRKLNASIVKSWFKIGQPKQLPFEIETGLTANDGDAITLRIESTNVDGQAEDDAGNPFCAVKILKGGLEYDPVELMPEFYRTVTIAAFKRSWRALVEMAEDGEPWSLEANNGDEKAAMRSIESYLKITFNKLTLQQREGKYESIMKRNNEQDLMFCTGLVTRSKTENVGSFIYAYLSKMNNGRYDNIEWITRYDPRTEAQDDERYYVNHNLPWPALWTEKPVELVYQYTLGSPRFENGDKDGFAFGHMIEGHPERFPSRYLSSCDNGHGKQKVIDRGRLERDIRDAWKAAKKRLCCDYKTAVPSFYSAAMDQSDDDDMKYSPVCLLVPLYLDPNASKPDVALVLRRQYRNGDPKQPYYFAPTILSISIARNNARVITRLNGTWLDA